MYNVHVLIRFSWSGNIVSLLLMYLLYRLKMKRLQSPQTIHQSTLTGDEFNEDILMREIPPSLNPYYNIVENEFGAGSNSQRSHGMLFILIYKLFN